MKNFRHFLILASLFFCTSSHALEFGLLGGINSNTPNVSNNNSGVSVTSASGYGLGAFFSLGLVSDFSIEIDGIFEHRSYTSGSPGTTYSLSDFQVPVFLRYSLAPLLNIGLGPYWSSGLGDVGVSTSLLGNLSQTYASAGLSQSDFGMATSLQLRVPITPFNHLIVDGRYHYGISNLATTAGSTLQTRELSLLAGLGFGI